MKREQYRRVNLKILVKDIQEVEVMLEQDNKKMSTYQVNKRKEDLNKKKSVAQEKLKEYDKDDPARFFPGCKVVYKKQIGPNIMKKDAEVVETKGDKVKIYIEEEAVKKEKTVKPESCKIKYLKQKYL